MEHLLGVVLATTFLVGANAPAYELPTELSDLREVAASPGFVQSIHAPEKFGDLERWHNRGDNYSAPRLRAGLTPHTGERIGVVGQVAKRYFQGAVMLYACEAWGSHNRFTSLDPRCEGHEPNDRFHQLGFAASTQLPGTVLLYRCRRVIDGRWTDHYDTTDVNCEGAAGAILDGPLGYIWHK